MPCISCPCVGRLPLPEMVKFKKRKYLTGPSYCLTIITTQKLLFTTVSASNTDMAPALLYKSTSSLKISNMQSHQLYTPTLSLRVVPQLRPLFDLYRCISISLADHYLLTKDVFKSPSTVGGTEMRKWICVELNQRFPWNTSHWKIEEREDEPCNYDHSYKGVHFLYGAISGPHGNVLVTPK